MTRVGPHWVSPMGDHFRMRWLSVQTWHSRDLPLDLSLPSTFCLYTLFSICPAVTVLLTVYLEHLMPFLPVSLSPRFTDSVCLTLPVPCVFSEPRGTSFLSPTPNTYCEFHSSCFSFSEELNFLKKKLVCLYLYNE